MNFYGFFLPWDEKGICFVIFSNHLHLRILTWNGVAASQAEHREVVLICGYWRRASAMSQCLSLHENKLVAAPCTRESATKFRVWNKSNGNVSIQYDNRCFDLMGGRVREGTPVRLWRCNNTSGQEWKTLPLSKHTFVVGEDLKLEKQVLQ